MKENIMLNFIYVNPALVNPKTKENLREQEIQKLLKLKEEDYTLIGLEMTIPELSSLCDLNIDPQHTDQKISQSCVKEICQKRKELLSQFVGKKVIFLTNRVDLDSVASYIVANNYLNGIETPYNQSLREINAHDTFQTLPWKEEKDIEEAFNPNNKTGALASTLKPFMVTNENITTITQFIEDGSVDKKVMESYQETQKSIIEKVKSGEVKVSKVDGVAVVETTLPCATNIGYCYAPIVIAVNKEMRAPDGSTYRKISIGQHEAGYVDLAPVKEALNQTNPGWGGNPNFIGSPQMQNCETSIEDLLTLVKQNLTPEYKTKVTSKSIPHKDFER